MNLARKMDSTRRRAQVNVPALLQLLFIRFMHSPIGLVKKKMQMLESMQNRYASLKLRKLHKKMEIEISILVRFLPRFMLLGITQRAFGITSLHGMQLEHLCEISMQKMASLRKLFRIMYDSDQSFSVEFVSAKNEFYVIHLEKKNGRVFMRSESYNQLGAELLKDGDPREVVLGENIHTTDIGLPPVKCISFNDVPFLMRLFYTPNFVFPFDRKTNRVFCKICSFYITPPIQQITAGFKKRRIG